MSGLDERHQHEWVRDEAHDGIRAWACTDCEATCATCGTCGRASGTSLLLCQPCEHREARVLEDIEHALGLWQASLRSLMHSPADMRLVRAGGTRSDITSPADVDSQLWTWVARWTEYTGADSTEPLEYLRSRHMWAAHNVESSGWDDYRRATRHLRAAARRIAGLLPQRLPEPCVMCGGDVVQDWADQAWMPYEDGLSDTVRCTRCGMTWGDRTRWRFTTSHHIVSLPGAHPDSLVTLEHARMIWPDVPAATWRSWIRRDREQWAASVSAVVDWWGARSAYGTDAWDEWARLGWTAGMLEQSPTLTERALPEHAEGATVRYRVGDLHAMVLRRADETRRGRPVRERMSA